MKRLIISFVLLFAMGAIYAESGTLTVTMVKSTPVTGITVITYDLQTAQIIAKVNETYNISVGVSFDGGDYTAINPAHLSGDLEAVSPAIGKQITWNGGKSFPKTYSTEAKVRLTATNSFICGVSTVTFLYNDTKVNYGTVVGANGSCWLDRNLGASRVANSSKDDQAYGDLFQWGRLDDGHQVIASTTTSTLSTTDVPGHDNFIMSNSWPYDWRNPQEVKLWQGESGTNNPCPPGWRVPTKDELEAEKGSWDLTKPEGAYESPLKWPMAGYRYFSSGSLDYVGKGGHYWSSTPSDSGDLTKSRFLNFFFEEASSGRSGGLSGGLFYGDRASGLSVRCIRD